MEYILNKNNHKISNICLQYNFQNPNRFTNQKISLMSMIFYNHFENITDKFKILVKYKNQSHIIEYKNGSYNVLDIAKIVDEAIQEVFNVTDTPIQISKDVNRYAILIIVKENWELHLDSNFLNSFHFTNGIIKEGYHRSDALINGDKVKFLKLYCILVDNKEDNEFLTNIFIKNTIGDQVTYENFNIYKSKKILDSSFDYIEACIKDRDKNVINMKYLFTSLKNI